MLTNCFAIHHQVMVAHHSVVAFVVRVRRGQVVFSISASNTSRIDFGLLEWLTNWYHAVAYPLCSCCATMAHGGMVTMRILSL